MKRNSARLGLTAVVLATALFAIGGARASGLVPLDVSVDDLTAAGVSGASAVSPAVGRFTAPVHYFRTTEKLSGADAKKDCADCADLIAVYAAESPTIPGWVAESRLQFIRIGGRLQVRAYIAAKRQIVTVTAPSEATARKISAYLVEKFLK